MNTHKTNEYLNRSYPHLHMHIHISQTIAYEKAFSAMDAALTNGQSNEHFWRVVGAF